MRLVVEMETEGKFRPDVITYTAVIKCALNAGNLEKGKEILRLMRSKGIQPDIVTYKILLRACGDDYKQALAFLQDMENNGLRPDLAIYESVTNTCFKAGQLKRLKEVRDKMQKKSIQPDIRIYNTLINAFGDDFKQVFAFFEEIEYYGLTPDVAIYNLVMNSCLKAGQLKKLKEIRNKMQKKSIQPSIVTYNILLNACGDDFKQAFAFFEEIEYYGLTPDVGIYNSVMNSCFKAGQLKKLKEVRDKMQKESIQPSIVTYNILLKACGDNYKEALSLLQEMESRHCLRADVTSYQEVLKSLDKAGGMIKKSRELLQTMKNKGLWPDVGIYNTMINSCGDDCELALFFLNEMRARDLKPDSTTYSLIFKTCARSGNIAKAKDTLRKMNDERIKLNVMKYTSMIETCSDYPELACFLINEMEKHGLEPDNDIISYGFEMKLYIRTGDFAKANEVLHKMKQKNIPRDFQFYTIMLGVNGNLKMQEILEVISNVLQDLKNNTEDQRGKMIFWRKAFTALLLHERYQEVVDFSNRYLTDGEKQSHGIANSLRVARRNLFQSTHFKEDNTIIDESRKLITVDILDVRFSQAGISEQFQKPYDKTTVWDLINLLISKPKTRPLSEYLSETISVFRCNHGNNGQSQQLYSIDNRRLFALRRAARSNESLRHIEVYLMQSGRRYSKGLDRLQERTDLLIDYDADNIFSDIGQRNLESNLEWIYLRSKDKPLWVSC